MPASSGIGKYRVPIAFLTSSSVSTATARARAQPSRSTWRA